MCCMAAGVHACTPCMKKSLTHAWEASCGPCKLARVIRGKRVFELLMKKSEKAELESREKCVCNVLATALAQASRELGVGMVGASREVSNQATQATLEMEATAPSPSPAVPLHLPLPLPERERKKRRKRQKKNVCPISPFFSTSSFRRNFTL